MCNRLLRTVGFVLLFASSINADTRSIGPAGINSAGLGLTGAGVRIGQFEPGRPGDAGNGDDAAHRNSTTNPADVFIMNNSGNPLANAEVASHAQEVAGVMISTSMVDGTGIDDDGDPLANGIAPTGVRANDFFTMEGAMATAVLRCGHVFSTIHMPTPGYQREHGTPK